MNKMQLSGSRRVRINRTVLTKESSNASVKRRRSSFGGNVNNAENKLIQGDPCASHRNSGGDQCSSQEKMSDKPNLRRLCTSRYAHVSNTCVVQLIPLDSKSLSGSSPKHMDVSLRSTGEGGPGTAGRGGGCISETEGNETVQKQSTLCLRDCSIKKQEKRLIKSPSCFTCCDVKFAPSRYDSLAVVRSCDSRAKETTKKQTSRKLDRRTGRNPVVKLCNISNIFSIPADFLHSRCMLPEELKRKSIHCFKRDCSEGMLLEFYPASRTSGRVNQPQPGLQAETKSTLTSQAQRPNDVADILTRTPSGGRCDRHVFCVDTDPNAHGYRMTNRMRASNGFSPLISLPTDVLESHGMVPVIQSTTVSSSCEPGALREPGLPSGAEMIKRSAPGTPPNRQDAHEESSLLIAGGGLAIRTMHDRSAECNRDTSWEGEGELDWDMTETFSCQRTTPYRGSLSCARTYISWPFQKLQGSGRGFTDTSTLPLMHAKAESAPVTDVPAKFRAPDFAKAVESVTAEGPASGTEVCMEPEMLSEMKLGLREDGSESVKLDEMAAKPALPVISLQTEPQGSSGGCGHRSNTLDYKEQKNGICEPEKVTGGHFWEMSVTQKVKLQCFKIPLKMDTDQPQFHPSKQSGGVVTPCRAAAGTKALSSSPTCTGRPPGVKSRPLASPERSRTSPLKVPAGCDSDGNTSLLSEDEAGDCVHPLDGVIMCEIKDSCSAPYRQPPSLGSNSRVEGGTEDAMDVVKAYEQDAIVLDVIQDDPELFGTITEELVFGQQKKPERPLHAKKGHHGNTARTWRRIIWDKKESFTEGPDPTQKYTDKGAFMLDINGETNSETVVSDGQPSNTTAGDERHLLAEESKAGPTDDGAGEWLWTDFMTSFQEEQSKMHPETFAQRAVNCTAQGAPGGGFSVNCAERETSTTRGSTPNTAGPVSGPPDRDVYCKYYFSSKHMCFRKVCWFLHVPLDGDEQFCTEVMIRFSRDANQSLLQRAAAVFVSYYQKCPPGIHFDLQALKLLLSALFKHGIIKDVLSVLRVLTSYRILPPSEFILALFDHCVDAGLPFTPADFQHMQRCLELLGLPAPQMNGFLAFKLRGLGTDAWKVSGEVQLAIAEVERCREQGDWTRMGTVFSSLCASQHSLAELRQLSGRVALALLKDSAAAPLPFAQFAQAVCQGSSANGLINTLIGRIGVSLMFRYYGAKQWLKGRQLLDTLKDLNINYSMLNSLFGSESGASQGRTVSVAVELLLNSGSMESALQLLKDNDWLSGSSPRPCDANTTQIRQAVLCQLADSCVQKGVHRVALEVLTKLPGLQDQADPAAASQHSELFNRHLSSCMEKQNLTVASDSVEFMFAKSVSVDMRLLRTLIHKLGKQNVWLKARSLFRCALSMGCYPPAQVNPYCRLLPIPYSLTEVEMAIAIEMFMVSNADEIHDPSQVPLQVVLRRKEGAELASDGDYNTAGNRLLFAGQIANPKLVIKYATVNPSQEQVFTLDPLSVRKWLTQNMKWANSIWRETGDDPATSDCLSG
ncbi:uncharacterized protein topaz1 isoform X2 [Paramormyrops kingsleyae]|uniref:uncharacterized protein topaz1 isoform X2 n=1 Tax=Paramormyrops kingsleyae TaxID=1676925 RepID=UPI003B979D48